MVNPAETPIETPAPAAPAAAPKDALLVKVEKCVESYRTKIAKLQEENQRLRTTIAEARNTNSRVRRIPKKKGAEVVAAEATA
jgi:SMC interacting uncharacterized protein involved in chromosome segregation